MKEYYPQEEDVLSYALFDKVALGFFEKRKNGTLGQNVDVPKVEAPANNTIENSRWPNGQRLLFSSCWGKCGYFVK